MIVSIICGMASQILRVPLLASAFFYVPDILLMLSMVFTVVAFGNPWYRKDIKTKEANVSPNEIEIAMDH
jgi:hypothetical protein